MTHAEKAMDAYRRLGGEPRWECIFHEKGAYEMRYFLKYVGDTHDGRIYAADNSGATPTAADDGELWIDVRRVAKMMPETRGGSNEKKRLYFNLPTRKDRDKGTYWCYATAEAVAFLVERPELQGRLRATMPAPLAVIAKYAPEE